MAPPTNIPPITPQPAKPSGPSGQVLPIVDLPDALKANARSIRLEGDVVAQNKDGSTRIKTAEGNIDVTFRGKQPQVGTKLEVDVPAGNPPRNVTVRPAPVAPQPLPTIPTLPQTPTTPPVSQAPAPTVPAPQPNAPDKPVSTQPTTQQPAPAQPVTKPAPAPSLPPLTVGEVVEIVPLLEAITAQIKPAPLPNVPIANTPAPQTNAPSDNTPKPLQNAVTQIEDGIVQKPQSGIVNALLQSLKTSLPNLLPPQVFNTPNVTPQPANTVTATSITLLPSTPVQSQITIPDLPQAAPLIAKIMAITSPRGQTMYATPEPTNISSGNTTVAQTPVQNITVTVTSLTPQNQPVVPLPLNINGAVQSFVIQTPPGTLPVGTQITFMPMAQQTGATVPSVVPQAWRGFLPFMQASSTWPVMDDIFQTFYQATPQAAQILGRAIPSPANAQNLGPAIMLFAAAARAGELQNWLGDKKLEMIHKLGKADLVSRLSLETSSLYNNNDLPATEWKSIPIPMLWQNEISKVMFHVRQEPREESKQDKDGNTRFILDLSLPRMGEVQLDGIVNGKRLDVIVRTQMPVSYPMQEAMKVAYAGALEGSDVYGELSFQGDIKQWMHVIGGDETFAASV